MSAATLDRPAVVAFTAGTKPAVHMRVAAGGPHPICGAASENVTVCAAGVTCRRCLRSSDYRIVQERARRSGQVNGQPVPADLLAKIRQASPITAVHAAGTMTSLGELWILAQVLLCAVASATWQASHFHDMITGHGACGPCSRALAECDPALACTGYQEAQRAAEAARRLA